MELSSITCINKTTICGDVFNQYVLFSLTILLITILYNQYVLFSLIYVYIQHGNCTSASFILIVNLFYLLILLAPHHFTYVLFISVQTGSGSTVRKKSLILNLMRSCREKEMKFLVRTLVTLLQSFLVLSVFHLNMPRFR